MPCGKPVENLAPPPKIQSGLTTSPPHPHIASPLPPHFPHFPHTSPTRKMLGKRISRCAPKRYMHPFPHFPNIRYILLPLFSLLLFLFFFSPIKKGRCWGSWGSPHLSPSLPVSYGFPHIFSSVGKLGKVGESWGCVGAKSVRFVGGRRSWVGV